MKAFQLKRIDKEYDMHLQAWLNHNVTSSKEENKKMIPVYKEFKDFFDYEARLEEVVGTKRKKLSKQQKKMAHIAAQLNAEGRF